MDVTESLDALRGKFADCLTVAFADISTGMVLASSSQDQLNQEHLDALCATATEMLTGKTASRISTVLAQGEPSDIQQAVIYESMEIGVFLKSARTPTDALCCACRPGIGLAEFLEQAHRHFSDLEDCMAEADGH